MARTHIPNPRGAPRKLEVEAVATQIKKLNGNISAVARHFKVARNTIYDYISSFPELKNVMEDSRETMLDEAESVLYNKALAGATPELIFFLKTKGRARGYVERQEVEHSGEQKMVIEVQYIDGAPDGVG